MVVLLNSCFSDTEALFGNLGCMLQPHEKASRNKRYPTEICELKVVKPRQHTKVDPGETPIGLSMALGNSPSVMGPSFENK